MMELRDKIVDDKYFVVTEINFSKSVVFNFIIFMPLVFKL